MKEKEFLAISVERESDVMKLVELANETKGKNLGRLAALRALRLLKTALWEYGEINRKVALFITILNLASAHYEAILKCAWRMVAKDQQLVFSALERGKHVEIIGTFLRSEHPEAMRFFRDNRNFCMYFKEFLIYWRISRRFPVGLPTEAILDALREKIVFHVAGWANPRISWDLHDTKQLAEKCAGVLEEHLIISAITEGVSLSLREDDGSNPCARLECLFDRILNRWVYSDALKGAIRPILQERFEALVATQAPSDNLEYARLLNMANKLWASSEEEIPRWIGKERWERGRLCRKTGDSLRGFFGAHSGYWVLRREETPQSARVRSIIRKKWKGRVNHHAKEELLDPYPGIPF